MGEVLMVSGFVAMAFAIVTIVGRVAGRRTREKIHCPVHDTYYDVDLHRRLEANWETGSAVNVQRCTHFDDPERVTCGKACLHNEQARARPRDRAATA